MFSRDLFQFDSRVAEIDPDTGLALSEMFTFLHIRLTRNPANAYAYVFSCVSPYASIIIPPLYPHPLLLLAADALKGIAQHIPLKQLVLDKCYLSPHHGGAWATIGTITTLEKLSLRSISSSFDEEGEICQVSSLLSLACSLMTSPSHYCWHPRNDHSRRLSRCF